MEVIVAVGIFVGAMALIGQLLDVGLRQAGQDQLQTIALLKCESKMEEIVAGLVSLDESLPKEPLEEPDDPRWRWRVVAEPTSVEGLLRVVVVIEFVENPEAPGDTEPALRESLTRLVVDPALRTFERRGEQELTGRISVEEMMGLNAEQKR